MKKIILSFMVVFSVTLQASIYTFTTNAGVLKLNDQLDVISFKGLDYKIISYKDAGSESNYVFCEHSGLKKLFFFDFSKGRISQYRYIETFEWKDVGLYDKAKLISGLYRNIDIYIDNNGIRGENATLFRQYANVMIEGIKKGTIILNGNGTFTDTTGQLSSSGTFDKNWIGKKKSTKNNILNWVADYILSYIKVMSTCNSNWEQEGEAYIILKADKIG